MADCRWLWTGDHHLRHSKFALREDKSARDVKLE